MKWALRLLILMLCFGAVARFCKKQTSSFTIARITSELPFHPEWEVTSPSSVSEIEPIVSQSYYFLGKGAQSFVFSSADGKYVIKFFRHDRLSAPFWLKWIPLQWARESIRKKESKLYKDFSSYKLAADLLWDETGLIYVHLNKTSHLRLSLDLVDLLGIHHSIPLDRYEFIVQKRATLAYTALEQWIKQGEIEKAKEALSSLVKLLALRSQKGIFDKDPDLNTNFGFIETRPLQIDIGRFKRQTSGVSPEELIHITDNLHQWLMQRAPELDEHLREELRKI